ncbi:MAG: ATP synthase F1 subunit delta, partial [Nonlabens ulvanivorans]
MSGSRAAIRYAKAVLSLAIDQKSTDAVQSDMKTITDTIAESTDLSQMLQSPVVKASDKKAVLTQVFTNTNAVTVNLIDTLIANKRLAILNDVAVSYTHLYDEMKGMQ